MYLKEAHPQTKVNPVLLDSSSGFGIHLGKMAPTIFFVPGLWEGPSVFDNVSSLLSKDGIKSEFATLRSTGTTSPGNPSMHDDINGIRADLEPIVSRGDDVVLVLHSAAGYLGSAAVEGLVAKHRRERRENGGVIGIVFITAGVLDVGQPHPPMAAFTIIEVSLTFSTDHNLLESANHSI